MRFSSCIAEKFPTQLVSVLLSFLHPSSPCGNTILLAQQYFSDDYLTPVFGSSSPFRAISISQEGLLPGVEVGRVVARYSLGKGAQARHAGHLVSIISESISAGHSGHPAGFKMVLGPPLGKGSLQLEYQHPMQVVPTCRCTPPKKGTTSVLPEKDREDKGR